MSRIEEIKARVEAATPGPWEFSEPNLIVAGDPDDPGWWGEVASVSDSYFNNTVDADFIAHARADVPYLLDELADSFPKTWSGLMAFVDHYYPRDIFTESDDQPGSRIVWLLRQLATTNQERDEALARVERAKAVPRERVCACVMYGGIAKCVRCEALAILEGDTE